ncbi:MAG: glycosyltransferase family 2 protein [Ramlibacter sp.]|nr:glycosyltransferase family 2 protein [Ramlibacter sp.]
MIGEPSVEVVLCTFNGARYLPKQLDSILAQTRAVQQISVYDDCSHDATPRVLESYVVACQERGTALNFTINPRNLGYAQNFSQGLAASTADVIFLCDQDDVWDPTKVEAMLSALKETGTDLVFSDGRLVDADGQRIGHETVLSSYGLSARDTDAFMQNATAMLMRRNFVNGAATAVRREMALQAMPVPQNIPHDLWLALWCSMHGRLHCIGKVLYAYRQHDSNVIGMGGAGRWMDQWTSIWLDPLKPRRQDLRRLQTIRRRFDSSPACYQRLLDEKLSWLRAVVDEPNRVKRASNIGLSLVQGRYRRFAPTLAFLRDVLGVVK